MLFAEISRRLVSEDTSFFAPKKMIVSKLNNKIIK